MALPTLRSLRLAATVAVALALSYGTGNGAPYLPPLLAFFLSLKPAPPMPFKKLLVLAVALTAILWTGLVVAPLVEQYPAVGLVIVGLGVYLSARLGASEERAAVGALLMMGLTLVSALGTLSLAAAEMLVFALVGAIVIAVISQWLVYPLLPEPEVMSGEALSAEASESTSSSSDETLSSSEDASPDETASVRPWRSVAVVMPAYVFLLTNPSANMPVMMKSFILSQAGEGSAARVAGNELVGATALGGVLAMGVWFGLKLAPTLWMYSLWVFLLTFWVGGKIYRPWATQYSLQFWRDTMVTFFILLGPAVADSANGKDPYQAFAVRFGLFFAVAIYAWFALSLLDARARRRLRRRDRQQAIDGVQPA